MVLLNQTWCKAHRGGDSGFTGGRGLNGLRGGIGLNGLLIGGGNGGSGGAGGGGRGGKSGGSPKLPPIPPPKGLSYDPKNGFALGPGFAAGFGAAFGVGFGAGFEAVRAKKERTRIRMFILPPMTSDSG